MFPDFIEYIPNFFSPRQASAYFQSLLEEIPWEQKQIKIFGRPVMEPRLTAWIGDPDAAYTYSGTQMLPQTWTPALLKIKESVEARTQQTFNSVLANLYRDGRDSMGFHSDDEKELGQTPWIASVSFGETRRLIMKHRASKTLPQKEYKLESGSLFIMGGSTQKLWKHGIPKETKPCGARVNLTFRKILNPAL